MVPAEGGFRHEGGEEHRIVPAGGGHRDGDVAGGSFAVVPVELEGALVVDEGSNIEVEVVPAVEVELDPSALVVPEVDLYPGDTPGLRWIVALVAGGGEGCVVVVGKDHRARSGEVEVGIPEVVVLVVVGSGEVRP